MSNNRYKIDQKSVQNRSNIDFQGELDFLPIFEPILEPLGGSLGLMLATFSEVFEVPRGSLNELRFQHDFEAIWEPRGRAKTSVSLQSGFSFQLFVIFSFPIAFSSILEAKMEPRSSPNGVQERL